jgi:predicted DNA-binding transcriptional regulator AlpA
MSTTIEPRLRADDGSATRRLGYSVTEGATAAGISRVMLYRLIRAGKGPKVTRIGGRMIILTPALERWLAELENAS